MNTDTQDRKEYLKSYHKSRQKEKLINDALSFQ